MTSVTMYVPLYRNVRCATCERPADMLWLSNRATEDGRAVKYNEVTPCGCRVYLSSLEHERGQRGVRR